MTALYKSKLSQKYILRIKIYLLLFSALHLVWRDLCDVIVISIKIIYPSSPVLTFLFILGFLQFISAKSQYEYFFHLFFSESVIWDICFTKLQPFSPIFFSVLSISSPFFVSSPSGSLVLDFYFSNFQFKISYLIFAFLSFLFAFL